MNTQLTAEPELFAVSSRLQETLVIFNLQHHRVDGWLKITQTGSMRQLGARIGQYGFISVPLVIQIKRIVATTKRESLYPAVCRRDFFRRLNAGCRLNNRHQIKTADR